MMKRLALAILAVSVLACAEKNNPEEYDLTTVFEKSEGTQTATYEEIKKFYSDLDEAYVSIKTYEIGMTDSGEPLTLITFNPDRTFDSEFADNLDARRILINNGIHPGEPDGIDATMMLMRDLASGKIETPEKVWVATIAVYNIGGALNRNSTSRTNQNGPESYGFRGNARNFDLNRDFIKADTRNARTFADLFQSIDPDVFIDNHVSNGADYQYTLTHLFTQHNKLGGVLGTYLNQEFQPKIEASLTEKDWDITPYVNVFNQVPEKGFSQFMDYPRYSTGYATLFNTLGLMVETHMLKPYKQRVEGTYELMKSVIDVVETDGEKIKDARAIAKAVYTSGSEIGKKYALNYVIDSSKTTALNFKGYEGEMVESKITGQERLRYDTKNPFERETTYYNNFKPVNEINIPKAYIIPKGWYDVIARLRENNIQMRPLSKDTTMMVETYKIEDYQTRTSAYEGHYPHYNTRVDVSEVEMQFSKGDILVKTAQEGMRYILETLEPQAVDSFFNWNYFDTILQQKEGFSPYVWEDKAYELLEENPELKTAFETKKSNDASFAQNWYAQLDWLHKKSNHYEKSHLRYPIFRVRG